MTDTLRPAPQLHLDNQVCFAAYAVSRRITQAYQPLLAKLGLTYPQYLVMLVLWQKREQSDDSMRVGELCDVLMLDTGTVTPLLKRMESAGLVSRRRSDNDERVVVVGLTDEGIQLREQAISLPLEALCQLQMPVGEALSLKARLWDWLRKWK